MAVGVLTAVPEFTKEIYDGITEKLFGHAPMREDDAPEGLIVHSAGQGDQGHYVYDIWESREAWAVRRLRAEDAVLPVRRAGRPTLSQRIAV